MVIVYYASSVWYDGLSTALHVSRNARPLQARLRPSGRQRSRRQPRELDHVWHHLLGRRGQQLPPIIRRARASRLPYSRVHPEISGIFGRSPTPDASWGRRRQRWPQSHSGRQRAVDFFQSARNRNGHHKNRTVRFKK